MRLQPVVGHNFCFQIDSPWLPLVHITQMRQDCSFVEKNRIAIYTLVYVPYVFLDVVQEGLVAGLAFEAEGAQEGGAVLVLETHVEFEVH